MFGARSIRVITPVVITLSLVVGRLVDSPVGFAQTPADGQGKVKIEWLGHEFYRLTSPKGVVVITSPGSPIRMVPCRWAAWLGLISSWSQTRTTMTWETQ